MHVTYFVKYIHGFTQISLEACMLGLNINYWLIQNYTRITPSNLLESERGDVKLSVTSIAMSYKTAIQNTVKTEIAVQSGVYKYLLPFICFSQLWRILKRFSDMLCKKREQCISYSLSLKRRLLEEACTADNLNQKLSKYIPVTEES